MKLVALMLLGSLAACNALGEGAPRTARAQSRLTEALAGKVAGLPQRCISRFARNEQQVIDRYTILYRNGADLLYRNDPQGGCGGLDRNRTLVVTSINGDLCEGDIIRVVEPTSGALVGSCAFSDFIPYTTRGSRIDPRGS